MAMHLRLRRQPICSFAHPRRYISHNFAHYSLARTALARRYSRKRHMIPPSLSELRRKKVCLQEILSRIEISCKIFRGKPSRFGTELFKFVSTMERGLHCEYFREKLEILSVCGACEFSTRNFLYFDSGRSARLQTYIEARYF